MNFYRMNDAYVMEALGSDLGWHGRLMEGNVYISAVYESRGLFVHTVERCLHFIPNEDLSYAPCYDAMRLELQHLIYWPNEPERGVPKGIRQGLLEPGEDVIESLHKITGLSKNEIQERIDTAGSGNGVMRFSVPPSKDSPITRKNVSFQVVEGFTEAECREGAIAEHIKDEDMPEIPGFMPVTRTKVQVLGDQADHLRASKVSAFEHPMLAAPEEVLPDFSESPLPEPIEDTLSRIETEIYCLRMSIVRGEDSHNDEVFDEYNRLVRMREYLNIEWEMDNKVKHT